MGLVALAFLTEIVSPLFLQKVNQKYITNREEFSTLQKIVLHEVEADVAQVRNSATEALLWLKR